MIILHKTAYDKRAFYNVDFFFFLCYAFKGYYALLSFYALAAYATAQGNQKTASGMQAV